MRMSDIASAGFMELQLGSLANDRLKALDEVEQIRPHSECQIYRFGAPDAVDGGVEQDVANSAHVGEVS